MDFDLWMTIKARPAESQANPHISAIYLVTFKVISNPRIDYLCVSVNVSLFFVVSPLFATWKRSSQGSVFDVA